NRLVRRIGAGISVVARESRRVAQGWRTRRHWTVWHAHAPGAGRRRSGDLTRAARGGRTARAQPCVVAARESGLRDRAGDVDANGAAGGALSEGSQPAYVLPPAAR